MDVTAADIVKLSKGKDGATRRELIKQAAREIGDDLRMREANARKAEQDLAFERASLECWKMMVEDEAWETD